MRCTLILCLAATSLVTGCASTQHAPPASTAIHHVVLIKLADPALRQALLDDCDRLLEPIPGVVDYWSGVHVETGRATVDSDYDVGLHIGFVNTGDYAAYVDHPSHVQLVETWRPRLEWLRVYDVGSVEAGARPSAVR